jgi:hypothetical protein
VDHTAPKYFDETAEFADFTTTAFAESTLHIYAHARTDFGVVFVAEAKYDIIAK